jgi:hypothetical protein
VEPHPHADRELWIPWLRGQRQLDVDCCADRLCRPRESRAERIADRLEHVPAFPTDPLAHDLVTALERDAHLPRMRLPCARRSLDVGEQQRYQPDGAATVQV